MLRSKSDSTLLIAAISVFITAEIVTNLLSAEIQTVPSEKSHESSDELCQTKACVLAASFLLDNMDESIDPCDNFYKFSCGNFEANTIIPTGKLATSSLEIIHDKLDEQVWRLIDQPVKESESKVFKLVKNFFQSCMNTAEIEKKGEEHLVEKLNKLGGWPVVVGDSWDDSDFSWTNLIYVMQQHGFLDNYLIDVTPSVDKKNSSRRILTLDRPTLGLGRKYLASKQGMYEPRVMEYWRYQRNVAAMLGANFTRATREVYEVIKFEMKLAELPTSNGEIGVYNPITIGELQNAWPDVQWLEFLNTLAGEKVQLDENANVLMDAPGYFHGLAKVMNETDKRTQANYLIWRAVAACIDCMNERLRRMQLDFISKTNGPEQRESRWKECTSIVSDSLNIAVAALYVRSYFKEEFKRDVMEIVRDLKTAFLGMLEKVDWMDNVTKNRAIEKLKAMYVHVGYPIELLNDTLLEQYYEGLELSSTDFLGNYLNITKFSTDKLYKMVLEPINKTDWKTHGKSAVVNAYYEVHENAVEFPAGILQGMFYGNGRPKYMNYGAIGMAIGHEISHGFDERGGQYDIDGNLNDWWDESTKRAFLERTHCMVSQYGNYSVPDVGLDLDGEMTENENIADNGGIKEAYTAYQTWVKRNEKPDPKLPGLSKYTPNQLFWISAANAWCSKYAMELLRIRVSSGDHPPGEFRVNGALSNMPMFANDFDCALGRKMNPVNKCSLW